MPARLAAVALGVALAAAAEGAFWRDARNLTLLGVERLADNDFAEAVPLLEEALRRQPGSPLAEAWLAHAFHLARRLDEAAAHYARMLRLEPARLPAAAQRQAILRHAPRVFQVKSDPFGLLAGVAVHHPEEPLISYHFFWEDDIDFPADNDPSDHELVWVRYDPGTGKLRDFYTYFHGRILQSPEAVREASAHGERPRVDVQWGKHGSLPEGWQQLAITPNLGDVERKHLEVGRAGTLRDYNFATYRKLHDEGREQASHPRTAAWPVRFEGSWDDFIRFDREVPYRDRLLAGGALAVSRWNNAVLQQRFLAFNFRPKTEWPDRRAAGATLDAELERRVGAASEGLMGREEARDLRERASSAADRFRARIGAARPGFGRDLPPMSLFRPETPRFPNLWFYAPAARFAQYGAFVRFLEARLREAGFAVGEVTLNEGADAALSLEHLQAWSAVAGLAHAHALHIRLFWKRLERERLERAGGMWRVAASVHYEVEHASPLHADVRSCPYCGRTGAYAAAGDLVEAVHDPLGLEAVLEGTIRGEQVGRARLLGFGEVDVALSPPFRQDVNTAVTAVVTLR